MSRCFVTAITRNYLADARALAMSIRRYDADAGIYVLCLDEPRPYFEPKNEPFRVLTLDEVLPKEDRSLLFYYTAFELSCAIRAYLHKYVLERTAFGEWAFLDSDISVQSRLDPLFAEMTNGVSGLYTPHCLVPVPQLLVEPGETSLLRLGVYNGGFLALKRSAEAAAFIEWYVARLKTFALVKDKGLYCDQLWLNLLPQYFPSMKCLQNPGANVAYWNIHERAITRRAGAYQSNGEPLLFFHFSQWRISRPHDLAWGRPVASGTDTEALAVLGAAYKEDLLASGFAHCRAWPYGYARFANGRTVTKPMRRSYYRECVERRQRTGSPFEHPDWFPVWRYPPDFKPAVRKFLKPLKRLASLRPASES
jgi:hypothetical protein